MAEKADRMFLRLILQTGDHQGHCHDKMHNMESVSDYKLTLQMMILVASLRGSRQRARNCNSFWALIRFAKMQQITAQSCALIP